MPKNNIQSRDERHKVSKDQHQSQRAMMETPPHVSNAYGDPFQTLPPDESEVPPRVVPMTPEDAKYMKETLHRDPAELLCRQVDNRERLGAREEELEAHAPGADLDEMATGDAAAASAAPPRVTADSVVQSAPAEKFQEVRVRNLKSEPTSKATRGMT